MAYLNVDEVESALTALATAHPGICELISLPNQTVEGRICHALRIGTGTAQDFDGVLFIGSIHAREWGGADICVNFATDLLEAYVGGTGLVYGGKSFTASHVRAIVEGLNVFVFPDVNPDGRNYSQMTVPLWRRNRNPAQSGGNADCIGVDLNRNFNFLWDFTNLFSPSAFVHTSSDPCDANQTYRGPSPASEQETKNVAWMFDQYPRIRWFVDLHSYGEDILYPWGDDEDQSDDPSMNFSNPAYNSARGIDGDTAYKEFISSEDLNLVISLANRMHDAIQTVRGKNYTTKQSFDLYPTSGTSDDYAYSRHLVDSVKSKIYGFTIEWGTSFQPPWAEMEKIISDITAGLVEFCLAAPCSGGIVQVDLVTNTINFNDVPEGETTVRSAVFSVKSCQAITFQIISGPTVTSGPAGTTFGTPLGTTASLPATTSFSARMARIWISYKGTNDGDMASGTVTIRSPEINQEWTIPITANTVHRPTVAIEMVLDKSNSMNFPSGMASPLDTRLALLKFSATPLVDITQEENAIGVAAFDHDAYNVMNVTPVGPQVFGAGRVAARAAILNHLPNPQGWTSIGDGVELAHYQLLPITGYDVKAMVVFTDGHENRPKFLADVMGLINERVYAIGLGTAEQIQPAALSALTNGTGGYLLLTGEITEDNLFLLTKYYLQILAGVTNHDIVLDPEGWLKPGLKHRIPFSLNETDISSDIILLSPAPYVFRFELETPKGDIIDPGTAASLPGASFVTSSNVSYYRITLPVPLGPASAGLWHALITIDERYYKRYLSTLKDKHPNEYKKVLAHGVRYSLNVHSYSNLRLKSGISQNSYQPGAELSLRAVLTEYGLPIEHRATVQAELERPDETKALLKLSEVEPGVFEVATKATMSGIYRFRISAIGKTQRGRDFTRDLLLTGAVYRGGDEPLPTGKGDHEWICRLIECILGRKTITPEFEEKLLKAGINIDALRSCLKEFCRESAERGGEGGSSITTEELAVLMKPEVVAAIQKLSSEIGREA